MCFNEPMLLFHKERVCLCTLSGGHCDTVWYVESYKQLALNSICKINSPRAGAAHIRLLPSSRPRFFLHFSFVYHPALSQTHPSNQLFALSSLSSTTLTLSPLPRPFISRILLTWLGTLWWSMRWLVVQLGVTVIWGQGQHRQVKGWVLEWRVSLAPSSGNVHV